MVRQRLFLYGSRAKGTALERSDIDIDGCRSPEFDDLEEKIEGNPYFVYGDLLDLDTCRNELLLEDIKKYGREI